MQGFPSPGTASDFIETSRSRLLGISVAVGLGLISINIPFKWILHVSKIQQQYGNITQVATGMPGRLLNR